MPSPDPNENRNLPVPRNDQWQVGQHYPGDRVQQAGAIHSQFSRVFAALRKRWWLPVATLVLFGLPATIYSLRTPATYASRASMWMPGKLQLPEGRMYSEELSSFLGTQMDVLRTPAIKQRALEKLGALRPSANTNQAAYELAVKTSVRSSTLSLEAVGPSAEDTRVFLDALMAEYLTFRGEARSRASDTALSSITAEVKELERQIKQREALIANFQASNNVAFLLESRTSAGTQMSRLAALISDLRTEYQLLESLTPEQFQDMAPTESLPVEGAVPGQRTAQRVASAAAPRQASYYQFLQQLQLLKARRQEFASVLRPTHSKMVRFDQEIAGLEQLLNTLRTQGEEQALAQMQNRQKALQLQIQNLESQYKNWETNSVDANWKLADYERLKQELDRSNALFNRLMNLVQTVDLTRTLDQESLGVLAPASEAKQTLGRFKFAAAGIFFGLLVGFGLLLILSASDDRFNSATELSLHLPEDIVGQVPESRANRNGRLLTNGSHHAFAESFRNLRSCLICMSDLPPGPRVIMVTSAVPKEGKTTISANLAVTLAMGGSRVLLVDADLRRSSLHGVFGLPSKPGLKEVLTGEIAADEAILETQHKNLWFLPSGDSRACGSELFLVNPVEQYLQQLKAKYDYILIDSAPVLATDDAGSLGALTQGSLVVVRGGATTARMINEALDRLRKRRVRILGVIYNRAPRSEDYYSHYASHYHGAQDASPLPGVIDTETSRE